MFAKDKYKPNLFNQDSDSDDGGTPSGSFGTNTEFAKNFNKLRSKELLKKHKNVSDSDSSSDSDDSSDNDTINPKFDEAFYKALASIKKKDPKIYTDNVKFFDDFDAAAPSVDAATATDRASKKPMTIVDYERKIMLEKAGRYEESDDDADANGDDDEIGAGRPQSPSYNQEQQNLRAEFKKVIEADSDDDDIVAGTKGSAAGDDGNAEWGGIFKRRDKSKAEEAAEEELYTKWLAGEEAANIGENAETLQPLKEYWANPKLAKEEAFLRDYILNNGYTKKSSGQVPCYDDIVGNRQPEEDEDDEDAEHLSDDEAELEKQAEFEHKYNFRFEEPDADFIKRYPRTIENSVRRTDDRRKEKRQEVKDRKQREKDEKLRELEMLSAMRKREIEDKIAKLKMVTGDDAAALCFDDADLDGDFDPEEHDRKMQEVFNSEYYGVDEGDEKPECPAELEDLQVEDWDNYDPREAAGRDDADEEGHCEDDDFDMDCEASAEQQRKAFQSELIESTRAGGKRKRKRKSKFMEVLQAKKPVFDPNDEKSFGEYLDEYYQLDYEDVVGDTPCRFKYTETVPNDFGLTVEEILMAKNKELNQWASLKKATQIRPEHVERNEIGLYKQKGKNEGLKRKILQSLYEVPSDEEEEETPKPANKKKPQPVSVKTVDNFVTLDDTNENEKSQSEPNKKKPMAKIVEKVSNANAEKSKSKNTSKTVPTSVEAVAETKTTEPPVDVETTMKRRQPDTTPNKNAPVAKKAKIESTPSNKDKKKITITSKPLQSGINKSANVNAKLQKNGQKKTTNTKATANKKPAAKSADAISDERLRAFGINPKKFHKKQKYGTTTKPANSGAATVPNGKPTPNGKPKQNGGGNKQKNSNVKNANNNRQPNRPRGGGRVAKPAKGSDRAALERMKAKMFASKKADA